MTVLENVMVAYHMHASHSLFASILRLPSHFKGEAQMREKAIGFLKIFNLDSKKDEIAKNLPYGEQRRLEIARALAARPKLLLLDEPSMGLAPLLVKEIFSIIQEINQAGTTVLLVEQNAHMALSIAHRAYVIETGKIVLASAANELAESDEIKKPRRLTTRV
jgi:branched-chain amino acid transport system ATP-binding protein